MRFRPLLPAAGWIVAAAAVRPVVLPLLHGGLRAAARDAPSRHAPRVRARADLPRLLAGPERQRRAAEGEPVRTARHRLVDWLCCDRGRRDEPLRPVRLPRSRVPRRQSRSDRLDHGHGPDRGAAGGDAPQRRLAAADHRGRADGLRAAAAASCPAFSSTPATPGTASSTTSTSRARASTASRSAWWRPTSSTTCCSACWRRASGSGRFFIDLATALAGRFSGGPAKVSIFGSAHVRHDLGLVDRQHRDGRLAHHSGDDPHRLCAAFRRRRRGGGRDRRADHAADHGRGRVPDGRISRACRTRPSSWRRSCRRSCISSACSARCTSRPRSTACAACRESELPVAREVIRRDWPTAMPLGCC